MALPFITFEGSEASGKSTQVRLLEARLKARGERVLVSREPGGTPLGEKLRYLLKHAPEGRSMCPETELLLFAASRAQLCREVLQPFLSSGGWVLCDRFLDSTTVYQGVARQLPPETVSAINDFAVGETRPALTLVLDLEPKEAARRLRLRSTPPLEGVADMAESPGENDDRIEGESREFFQRVREGYLRLAEAEPERVKLIQACGSVEEVEQRIWKEVAHGFTIS